MVAAGRNRTPACISTGAVRTSGVTGLKALPSLIGRPEETSFRQFLGTAPGTCLSA